MTQPIKPSEVVKAKKETQMTAKQPQPAPERPAGERVPMSPPPKKEPRLAARRPAPEQMAQRDWEHLVSLRGVSGTANLLRQMQETIDSLEAELDRQDELIRDSASAKKMEALQQENVRLKSLLAGCYDTQIVGGIVDTLEDYGVLGEES